MTAADDGNGPHASAPKSPAKAAWALFISLFVLYHVNVSNLDEGDAVPSANLPVALLATGRLSFDPDHFPEMFKWRSHPPFIEQDDFFFLDWDAVFGDRRAREWRKDGKLEFNGPRYYVVESPVRHVYVSTFGPIPGLALLPFVAPFYAVDHALHTKTALRASVAKLGSASMVAACAVLVFLIALRKTTRPLAFLLAAIYGVGTCAWAVSSQNIWQQTVNQLFLTLGAYGVLGEINRKRVAAFAGLALGAAVACRATGAIVVAATLAHLVLYHRRSVLPFVLGALPIPLAVAVYNFYYFGSPLSFAQELVGHAIAVEKTGSPELWQTPLYKGALGLLVSPSRGLVVFSPVLVPAFWGMARTFREREWHSLRPFAAAALLMMAVQCKWFDWWGGHAYGYRPWLDAVPYLVLCLLPVARSLTETRARRALFGAVFAWSVFVQALGALTYDRFWNLRQVFVVRVPGMVDPKALFTEAEAEQYASARGGNYLGPSLCDIDYPFCRYRLWSLEDNMILYQLTHLEETRGGRLPMGYDDLGNRH
jgi:hypothetical protein